MGQPADDRTAYGHDQDREPPKIRPDRVRDADRNPDDFGPETMGTGEVNPATGVEYGEIDHRPAR